MKWKFWKKKQLKLEDKFRVVMVETGEYAVQHLYPDGWDFYGRDCADFFPTAKRAISDMNEDIERIRDIMNRDEIERIQKIKRKTVKMVIPVSGDCV